VNFDRVFEFAAAGGVHHLESMVSLIGVPKDRLIEQANRDRARQLTGALNSPPRHGGLRDLRVSVVNYRSSRLDGSGLG
jgi:hypothetical protein